MSNSLASRRWWGSAVLMGLVCAAGLLRAAEAADAHPKLLLGLTNETYPSLQGIWVRLIYGDAFARLGYRIEVRPYPAKRLTAMVESGELDGELHRATSYLQEHPTLVRVEQSHFHTSFAAYAISDLPVKGGWNSLLNTNYRVEYRAGVHRPEIELKKVIRPERLSSVSGSVLGLRKLLAGRTDIFIDHENPISALLASQEFRSSPIRRIALMEDVAGHVFLNARHRELASALAVVLTAMKNDGSVERYRRQAQAAFATQQ